MFIEVANGAHRQIVIVDIIVVDAKVRSWDGPMLGLCTGKGLVEESSGWLTTMDCADSKRSWLAYVADGCGVRPKVKAPDFTRSGQSQCPKIVSIVFLVFLIMSLDLQ